MILYHTGYQELRQPDVHYGRKMQSLLAKEEADFQAKFAAEMEAITSEK